MPSKTTLTAKAALSRIARYIRADEEAGVNCNDLTATQIIDLIERRWDARKSYNGHNSWEAWDLFSWWSQSEQAYKGWRTIGRQHFRHALDIQDGDIKKAAGYASRNLGELMAQQVEAGAPRYPILSDQNPTKRFWKDAQQAVIKEIDWERFAHGFIVEEIAQEESDEAYKRIAKRTR